MNQNQLEIPIQPVERPILCSPYEEPDAHWVYDTKTGEAIRQPGRRDAGYWYKTETHRKRGNFKCVPSKKRNGMTCPW